ncbi:methyltransferase domain-containing protein [Mycolicibacterium helvum]|uniref:SAM-dependent methyltransferase n=1 Tax=Mycolicibacterium helvum TaxID=1534349 RepID=A0A7I7T3D3_9MYCO|nr:hypothetical protein [Mycolicibacterium helvum]BBY62969.1 hypothetical protein MHEL_12120 [Mycolicibacterium helvum]
MKLGDKEFNVRKFSFFSNEDPYDMRFGHLICWSRIYEYPFVLSEMRSLGGSDLVVHNCCWGFTDIHLVFKTWLDIEYPGTIHSDIRPSTLWNTAVWNVANEPTEAYVGRFDVVINISTLEEVNADHIEVMKNHLAQLRKGGRFICTFDFPGLQLDRIEAFLGAKITEVPSRVSPLNSRLPNTSLGLPDGFTCGYLVIERTA